MLRIPMWMEHPFYSAVLSGPTGEHGGDVTFYLAAFY